MSIEVIKESDGSLIIRKTGQKECKCSPDKVLAEKAKIDSILFDFDQRVADQRAKIISDFDSQMNILKSKYQSRLVEVEEVLSQIAALND